MDNKVSIGVFVYNEEKNISNILTALSKQKTRKVKIDEILVVSSGSTDRTDEIISKFARKNRRIKLVAQKKREGKASAINLFLRKAKNDIVTIESGDTIPKEDCIENLCSPFLEDKNLGLTGARAIPTNDKNTYLGYIIHYWWWMHNELPRFGEMIAFRKHLAPQISDKTAVDEAYVEAIITNKGYGKRQIPSARINNHGAETLRDLIKQRKRVYIGHLLLQKEKSYSVQSFNSSRILGLTLKYLRKEKSLKGAFYIFLGFLIEVYSRAKGFWEMKVQRKNPYIWQFSKNTK
jgi:cellulose synthase/poly-beta-1,6-N-acetylglucosamine synthase-like glycosyltransferase